MEITPARLDELISSLQRSIADCNNIEMCALDDYKFFISLNNVSFYDVKGNYNAVGERNVVNSGLICEIGDVHTGNLGFGTLDKSQRVLLDKYNSLDVICRAKLITYADELSTKGGDAT